MIKAVIFDCFGVLTKDWWREFCASVPPGPGLQKAKELNHLYDAGLISLKEFVAGVEQVTGREPQPIEDIFASPEPIKNTTLLEYIKSLKTGYKIGMISNVGTNWVRDYFLSPEEQRLFDDMVFSFEVGTTKPDPRIYELATKRLGLKPQDCVFIDDIERYCEAARATGMKAILYKDFEQMKTELDKLLQA
ncbi:HAD family phosphatase [Candidatus Saccharibacteria bacterium]|nr:HAD family phosphatase [Candidatus Saccharibacteria bacterium]